MKKISFLMLFMALFSVLKMNAELVPVRLDIDDPTRVTIDVDGVVQPNMKAGLNTLQVQSGSYVYVTANPGCSLVSVAETNDSGYRYELQINAEDGEQFAFIPVYSDYGDTYVITSALNEDVQTATLTIDVDEASKVIATLVKTDKVLDLANGENTIKFNADQDKTLKLAPVNKDLYKVTVNGTVQPSAYSYTIPIADGTKIDILANYPDVDYSVKFTLTGDDAEDFISGVDVEGRPVTNYMAPDFKVHAGDELTIHGRTTEYEVLSFKINGMSVGFANPTTILVTDNLEISLNVQKYASFKVTLTVDDPSHIHLYDGYYFNGKEITLQTGPNTIEVNRNYSRLDVVPAEGFYIESIQLSEYTYNVEELKGNYVDLYPLYAGDIINITTGAIDRNLTAMLYVSNLEAAADYFSITRSSGVSPLTQVNSGYNEFAFFNRDNTFRVETGAPVASYVYLNEEQQSATYPESPYYEFDLNNNDVVKVFFGDKPSVYAVSVEVPVGLEGELTLKRDYISEVSDWEDGFDTLEGTYCSLLPNGKLIDVKYNDENVEADAAGRFNFTVTAAGLLEIINKDSGIYGLSADEAEYPVYTLQGVRVSDKASRDVLENLSEGIYIVAGKKIVVK